MTIEELLPIEERRAAADKLIRLQTAAALKVSEAADYTGFSHNTIRQAIKKGHLRPCQKGGGKMVLLREDLENWLKSMQVKA